MSARDDWCAGRPCTVIFSVTLDTRNVADKVAAVLTLRPGEINGPYPTACPCCDRELFRVDVAVHAARRDLWDVRRGLVHVAAYAGGDRDSVQHDAVVMFDGPDDPEHEVVTVGPIIGGPRRRHPHRRRRRGE
jgi:hypothetical protein